MKKSDVCVTNGEEGVDVCVDGDVSDEMMKAM